MKLFCSPGISPLAPQIAFQEAGMAVELVGIDPLTGRTRDGRDFSSLNPFADLALLELDDGTTLRGAPVILQFVADRVPSASLAPSRDSMDTLRISEWLHLATTAFGDGLSTRSAAISLRIGKASLLGLAWLDLQLAPGGYLVPCGYSIADIYVWTLIAGLVGLGDDREADEAWSVFTNVRRWHRRIGDRIAVKIALANARMHCAAIPAALETVG